MFFPYDRAAEVLDTWTHIAPSLPEEMMTWTSLLQFPDMPDVPEPLRGGSFTVFHGAFLGGETEGAELLSAVRTSDRRWTRSQWSRQSPLPRWRWTRRNRYR